VIVVNFLQQLKAEFAIRHWSSPTTQAPGLFSLCSTD